MILEHWWIVKTVLKAMPFPILSFPCFRSLASRQHFIPTCVLPMYLRGFTCYSFLSLSLKCHCPMNAWARENYGEIVLNGVTTWPRPIENPLIPPRSYVCFAVTDRNFCLNFWVLEKLDWSERFLALSGYYTCCLCVALYWEYCKMRNINVSHVMIRLNIFNCQYENLWSIISNLW